MYAYPCFSKSLCLFPIFLAIYKVAPDFCTVIMYVCFFLGIDKQLVELIHVKALDVLRGHEQSSMRYQSVTLFLRGMSTVCSVQLF